LFVIVFESTLILKNKTFKKALRIVIRTNVLLVNDLKHIRFLGDLRKSAFFYLGNEPPLRKQWGILLTNMSSLRDFKIYNCFRYCYFVPLGLCIFKSQKISPQAAGYLP